MSFYLKNQIPPHLLSYFAPAELGLEKTPEGYVGKLVAIFREVRRVLRDDGTLWLNLGDSYASGGRSSRDPGQSTLHPAQLKGMGRPVDQPGLKPKDLLGIPWMVAKALQQPYYTGNIKDERDRIWLAAIIDGEGCFFIHRRKAGTPSYSTFTRADGSEANYLRAADTFGVGLEICNTNKAIIDRVQAIVGGGTIITQSPKQNSRRKQTIYRWRVAPVVVKRIAKEVYPYLVGKKHQARLIFNCPSTGESGTAAHQAMMDLHNGVGTTVDYPEPPTMYEPGWYLRQDIIWAKPAPMPESVTDRCTKSHEYIFLLSKSARYYFDAEAIAESAAYAGQMRGGSTNRYEQNAAGMDNNVYDTRNKRSVWTVQAQPYPEAHFATFPPKLIEPCILAGCPKGGTVLDPFTGSGTTGYVSVQKGRNFVGIELNPAYVKLAEERIQLAAEEQATPLFDELENA